jgi:hypothetical protein
MRNACHLWLFTLLLVLMSSIPAAAQPGPQQASRTFRTEPMGNGYARTGVNTAIFRGSSLVTSESTQYAAFYDEQGRFVLARRTLVGQRHFRDCGELQVSGWMQVRPPPSLSRGSL